MLYQAILSIPPHACDSLQMIPRVVSETSKLANVRFYAEQAIGRIKCFRILKDELPITYLPLYDDIPCVLCYI